MSNPRKGKGRRTKAEGACVVGILVVDVGEEIVSCYGVVDVATMSPSVLMGVFRTFSMR